MVCLFPALWGWGLNLGPCIARKNSLSLGYILSFRQGLLKIKVKQNVKTKATSDIQSNKSRRERIWRKILQVKNKTEEFWS